MIVAFHVKNSVFIIYLLEDEQELSLRLLDTSPTYLQFLIVPCYYSINLGCFICHYISFFGSKLLTQCPVPVAVFCLFLPFQKIIIKKCPNEKKKLWINFFWTRRDPGSFGRRPEEPRGSGKHGGRAQGGRRTPRLVGPLWHLLT